MAMTAFVRPDMRRGGAGGCQTGAIGCGDDTGCERLRRLVNVTRSLLHEGQRALRALPLGNHVFPQFSQ